MCHVSGYGPKSVTINPSSHGSAHDNLKSFCKVLFIPARGVRQHMHTLQQCVKDVGISASSSATVAAI